LRLCQRNFAFLPDLDEQNADDQSCNALNAVGGDIHKGRGEAVQEAFKCEITEHHHGLGKKSADDS